MNVIGYTRVSTNEQAENGVSMAAQEQRIRAHCRQQGWRCIAVVRDDGASGKDLRRPGIQRLLDELPRKDRRFAAIVVAKLDRLTRSVKDLIRLSEETRRHGVDLVSIAEAVDTRTATGKMFYTLVTVISEWERGVIGERTREALAQKRRNGERLGVIPYGYTLAKDGRHLLPVPRELKVIQQIRHQREALKLSYAMIADTLNADRIKTKKGGAWQPATIRSVLQTLRRREAALGQAAGPDRLRPERAPRPHGRQRGK